MTKRTGTREWSSEKFRKMELARLRKLNEVMRKKREKQRLV